MLKLTQGSDIERCDVCQFPVKDCQCNIMMGSRPNPFMACAWCGLTQKREATIDHLRSCKKRPCEHVKNIWTRKVHMAHDQIVSYEALECLNCPYWAIIPQWMRTFNARP